MGVMKFTISCLLPYRCCIPNMIKIGPVDLEKKMLMDDAHTLHDDGRQPISIGHLSDSGDLKTLIVAEHTLSKCWTHCERWEWTNNESRMQNYERWTHGERTLNRQWTKAKIGTFHGLYHYLIPFCFLLVLSQGVEKKCFKDIIHFAIQV